MAGIDNREERRTARSVVIYLAIGIAFLMVFGFVFGAQRDGLTQLDNRMVVDVLHSDGSTQHYGTNRFSNVGKGDTVTFTIPALGSSTSSGPTLFFSSNNCMVHVYCGDDLIFSQGGDIGGMPIGRRVHAVPLPSGYEQSEIRVSLALQEQTPFSSVDNVFLGDSSMLPRAILAGKGLYFLPFVLLFIASLLLFFCLVAYSIAEGRLSQSFWPVVVCLLGSLWVLGREYLLYLFSSRAGICSKADLIAAFLLPAAIAMFVSDFFSDPRKEQAAHLLAGAFCALCAGGVALSLSPLSFGLCDLQIPLAVGALASFVAWSAFLLREDRYRTHVSLRVLIAGMVSACVLFVFELLRLFLRTRVELVAAYLRVPLLPYAMLIFLVCVAVNALLAVLSQRDRSSEASLRHELSLRDPLCDVPNRLAFYRDVDMDLTGHSRPFSIVYVEVSGLHRVNTEFGPEAGDKLLKVVGLAMKNAFDHLGFFCRWGGDEFVACVIGGGTVSASAIKQFKKNINKVNASERFPFQVNVLIGKTDSTPQRPLDPYDAVKEAAQRMRKSKRRRRQQRASHLKGDS